MMNRMILSLLSVLTAIPLASQELSQKAMILKNASDKELADFYDCIEYRAVLKHGHLDDSLQLQYINEQSEALFEYFALRDSLINDPVSAAMMLKVAWKWGASDGGICNVDWTEALREIRANLMQQPH